MCLVALLMLPWSGGCFAEDIWDSVFKFQSQLADEGFAGAQFKLAEMYEEGRGTPQNLEMAKFWYNKAAAQGVSGALQRLKTLGKRRPAQERNNDIKLPDFPTPGQAQAPSETPPQASQDGTQPDAKPVQNKPPESRAAAPNSTTKDKANAPLRSNAEAELQREVRITEKALSENAKRRQANPHSKNTPAKSAASKKNDSAHDSIAQPLLDTIPVEAPVVVSEPSDSVPDEVIQIEPLGQDQTQDDPKFKSNPCTGPAAKFLSTCK